jgi:hypothetical protein
VVQHELMGWGSAGRDGRSTNLRDVIQVFAEQLMAEADASV